MKIIKVLITALLLIILAALAVGGYVLATFDPNEHKDRIITAVKQQTGRTLAIDGDIGLSLFPWLGVEINKVALSNPPGMAGGKSADNFATIGTAMVHLKLLPLLKRQLEVDTVTLQDLHVTLLTDARGSNNWTFATAPTAQPMPPSPTPAPAPTPRAEPGAAAKALAGLSVGGIDLRNARLDWQDVSGGTQLSLSKLSLKTGPLVLGQETPVELSMTIGGIATQDIPLELAARVSVNDALDRVDVSQLTLRSNALTIEAAVSTRLVNGTPEVSGQLTLPPFKPRQVMRDFGVSDIATTSPDVLQQASGQIKFRATPDRVSADDIKLQLDDSTLRGDSLVKLAAAAPHIEFSLTLDHINADHYLPPAAPTPATPAGTSAAAAIALPTDTLRQLDLRGETKIGRLTVANLDVQNISATVNAKNGLIQIYPVKAELYQGQYNGNLRLDVRQAQPRFAMREALQNIQIAPFLKDLLDNDLVSGQASLNFDITTAGTTNAELTRQLNGSAAVSFKDGAVNGINIADMIRQAQARLENKPVPAATTKQTDFTAMTATLNIKNGIAHNNDLDARAPYLRVSGKGQADLNTAQLDYQLTARLVETEAGQGGAGLDSLKGIDIPIKIAGPFAGPDIKLDSAAIRNVIKAQAQKKLQQEADKEKARLQQQLDQEKERLRQEAEQERERLKREAEEKLRNKLKSLF